MWMKVIDERVQWCTQMTVPAGAYRVTAIGPRSAWYNHKSPELSDYIGAVIVPDEILLWPSGYIGVRGRDCPSIYECKLEPAV